MNIDRFKLRVFYENDYTQIASIFYDCQLDIENEGVFSKHYKEGKIGMPLSDCILMQCTGLKDKNNKLIYEGDILEMDYEKYDGSEDKHRSKVEWLNNYWYSDALDNCNHFDSSDLIHNQVNARVIGNIYENQDLLNQS